MDNRSKTSCTCSYSLAAVVLLKVALFCVHSMPNARERVSLQLFVDSFRGLVQTTCDVSLQHGDVVVNRPVTAGRATTTTTQNNNNNKWTTTLCRIDGTQCITYRHGVEFGSSLSKNYHKATSRRRFLLSLSATIFGL